MNTQKSQPERFFTSERCMCAVRSGKIRTFLVSGIVLCTAIFGICTLFVPSALKVIEVRKTGFENDATSENVSVSGAETMLASSAEAPLYEQFPLTRIPQEDASFDSDESAISRENADSASYIVPTLTDNQGISYPREAASGPVFVCAQSQQPTFHEGTYTVHILEGNCELTQGHDSFKAEKMVLWVSPLQYDENQNAVHHLLMYLENGVEITFVTSRTTSAGKIVGGTLKYRRPSIKVDESDASNESDPSNESNKTFSDENRTFYARAKERMFRPAQLLLTQYSTPSVLENGTENGTENSTGSNPENGAAIGDGEVVAADAPLYTAEGTTSYPLVLSTDLKILPGDVSSFDPNTPRPGARRIGFFQRNDVPLAMSFKYDDATGKYIAIFDKGVTLLIDGADDALKNTNLGIPKMENFQIGTIDISADRLVVWSDSDLQMIQQDRSLDLSKIHLELYLEGNIIFRQGEQEIYAEKMYFDVSTRRGLIREAEVFATIPKVEGLLRLRAEEIRIPEEGMMLANDTFVTTSRIGEPMYRLSNGQLIASE